MNCNEKFAVCEAIKLDAEIPLRTEPADLIFRMGEWTGGRWVLLETTVPPLWKGLQRERLFFVYPSCRLLENALGK